MKIGIFAYTIKIGGMGGVQQYTERLIYGLSKYSAFEIVVFCSSENSEHLRKYLCKTQDRIYIINSRIKFLKPRVINGSLKEIFKNRLVRKSKFLYKITSLIFYNFLTIPLLRLLGDYKLILEKEVDVIHFPYPYLNRYDLNIPTLISMHDLQHKYFPEFFYAPGIKKRDDYYRSSAELCSRIIVSFNHVKNDIINFYNISSEKIDVCRPGLEIQGGISAKVMKRSNDILEKYKVPEDFLIYPAAPSPHKNHIRLIRALRLLHSKYNKKISLVVTGRVSSFDYDAELKNEINKLGLNRYVTFTEWVSNEELYVLLKKSSLVVIPTLYEAGSGPLDEAIALGTPVICSNVTALPEQIGDEKFLFDPYDVEKMAEKIYLMLTDEKLRKENIENSQIQAEKFGWKNTINSFINSYKKAIEEFEI